MLSTCGTILSSIPVGVHDYMFQGILKLEPRLAHTKLGMVIASTCSLCLHGTAEITRLLLATVLLFQVIPIF